MSSKGVVRGHNRWFDARMQPCPGGTFSAHQMVLARRTEARGPLLRDLRLERLGVQRWEDRLVQLDEERRQVQTALGQVLARVAQTQAVLATFDAETERLRALPEVVL